MELELRSLDLAIANVLAQQLIQQQQQQQQQRNARLGGIPAVVTPPGYSREEHLLLLMRRHSQLSQMAMAQQERLSTLSDPTYIQNLATLAAVAAAAQTTAKSAADQEGCNPMALHQVEVHVDKEKKSPEEFPAQQEPATETEPRQSAARKDPPALARQIPLGSLLRRILELPFDTRQCMRVIGIHLERSSISKPWGLRLISDGNDRLFFTHIADNVDVSVKWCHVVPLSRSSDINGQQLFLNSVYSDQAIEDCQRNAEEYSKRLFSAVSGGTISAGLDNQRRLYPGDMVLAIDGHSLAEFGSMGAITNHLKNCETFSVVVARHDKIASAALWSTSAANAKSEKDSFHSPLQINLAWRKVLSPPTSYDVTPRTGVPSILRNRLYRDQNGLGLPYKDYRCISDDGTEAKYFLAPIDDFPGWLAKRKMSWRRRYNPRLLVGKEEHERVQSVVKRSLVPRTSISEDNDRATSSVAIDFWTQQGFASFEDWLASRVVQWKFSYSWNKKKRKRIEEECEEVVHISEEPNQFHHWLSIRKRQWRLQRRKRQRLRGDCVRETNSAMDVETGANAVLTSKEEATESTEYIGVDLLDPGNKELVFMDKIIEAEEAERRKQARKRRSLIDLARFFDSSNGIPDDIIARCFQYLEPREHIRLLQIDRATRTSLQQREEVWKSLCPKRWILPRRPRMPWFALYCSRLKREHEQRQKQWDDLLVKCAGILDDSDFLSKIEKMVTKAEKSFGFDVNYVSGVVCERNSLLNLAVIHKRHKVAKWLVETKKADIETYDRGNFTPLLNAAWEGNRSLVRFFLQRGANRKVKGTQHYSKGIAPAGFEGKTAEEWAIERGHADVAKLIRLGF